MNVFNIQTLGAQPDNPALSSEAIRKAALSCREGGGGTIYVPAGVFRCAPFEMGSNTTLYLEAGAVLLGSERLEDYPIEQGKLSQESRRAGLVSAFDAENVTITGRGMIDGSALAFLDPNRLHQLNANGRQYTRQGRDFSAGESLEDGPLAHDERPGNLIRFHHCRNVQIDGITIRNSPTWTVHFRDCQDVIIHGIRIHSAGTANRTPNDDGIDLETCAQVRISDCEIDTGDDCIALFGSQAVTVTNCTLRSRSAGVRVNYDTGLARDLVFSNLIIDAHRGITMMCRGEAVTENVLFNNLVIRSRLMPGNWWGLGEPISITALPGSSDPFPPGQAPFNINRSTFSGHIRNVRFSHIIAEGEHGIVLWGAEGGRIQDIRFDDIRLKVRNSPYHASMGGNIDLRPAADPALNLFAHDIPAIFARGVDQLALNDVVVTFEEGLPEYFTQALRVERFEGLQVNGFRAVSAHPTSIPASIWLREGKSVYLAALYSVDNEGSIQMDQVTGVKQA